MTSPFNIMDMFKWFLKLNYVYKLVAFQLNKTSQEFIFDLCLVFIHCFFPHLLTFQEDYNLNVIIYDILLQDVLQDSRHGNSISMLGQIQLHLSLIWFNNLFVSYIVSSLLNSYNSFHVVCFWKSKLPIF